MSVDATKIAYSNEWDIDQLLATAEIPVGSGTTAVYTISGAITFPEFEVQFKPTGSPYWYSTGTNSTDGTIANLFTFFTYIDSSVIYINTTTAGTARYFVWADKFNY